MSLLAILVSPTIALAATPAQSGPLAASPPMQSNLLGNGGFERWSYGAIPDGPIPPDLWWPMGMPQDLFSQAAIEFKRVASAVPAGACEHGLGDYVVEITPTDPGNYVSQLTENASEFRGRYVTFSLDFSTPFGIANPGIEVLDGVTSTSASVIVDSGCWERVDEARADQVSAERRRPGPASAVATVTSPHP